MKYLIIALFFSGCGFHHTEVMSCIRSCAKNKGLARIEPSSCICKNGAHFYE